MKDMLKNLTSLFVKNDFHELDNAVEEKKFLYLYALYHYYNGDEDNIIDVIDNCPYNKAIDNFAQGFFEVEDFEEKTIDILIPYYLTNEDFDITHVRYMLGETQNTMYQLTKNEYTLKGNTSEKLKDIMSDDTVSKICVNVVTNYVPDFDTREEILDVVTNLKSIIKKVNVEYNIIFGNDVKNEVKRMTADNPYVEDFSFTIDKPNNYLTYGIENSVICNIMASSIKYNYKKYGDILLSKNLRFYVPNKTVDEGIVDSIRNDGDNFWYYNNGIIIVCDDYTFNGDKVIIKKGSIVNGGQTTRMIGDIPFADDFCVSCKIIKSKYSDEVENTKFIADVAEASNTQKPIKASDLIANRYEQRIMKQRLADAGVYMQIKRGEATASKIKENYPEVWQRTKNDELAQVLFATMYQKPGAARNSKSKIFSDQNKYKTVFGDINYDIDLLKDLLLIQTSYKKWRTKILKSPNSNDVKLGLTKNGFFYIAASIILMAKFSYSEDLINYIKEHNLSSPEVKHVLTQKTFNHRIFRGDLKDLYENIFPLFELVYDKYLNRAYNTLKQFTPDLAYSNLTKTDKNYYSTIVSYIFDDFAYEINGRVLGVIKPLFYNLTDEDKEHDTYYLNQAITSFKAKPELTITTNPIDEKLTLELNEFRTKTYKKNHMKAYNVFLNKERDAIVALKPKTIGDLEVMGCFSAKAHTKIKRFGQDIVDIVNSVCGYKK